ncbi:hypothetical protein L195_g037046 [Trifolium pratense]|uniref:Reverse transcriptase zinc-binding domain-containing protein n=1 Tax=Trifolium pratense TaxID=57577 RepID=A0A2K3LR70_TRIPR|nr:hypothetical protein L195_g037046 [Trifolium pratense]
MSTDENLMKRGCTMVSICVLCMASAENNPHIFLHCPFADAMWKQLDDIFQHHFDTTEVPIRLKNAPKVSLVLWQDPSILWVKVNTDGSFLHNSSACEGIIRGHYANHLWGFTSKRSHVSDKMGLPNYRFH